jgi:hypothetical protein
VWHDSDDERLTISLASHQRLRKLRVTEAEDFINGKEYIKRLRRQFEQLHPVPDWANPQLNKKRTDSDSDLDSDMDTDDENERLSTQPLAKLLQGATDLTRLDEGTGPGGKRKLRQEVIDIHRLKDVGKDQPVSCVSDNSMVLVLMFLLASLPSTRSCSTLTILYFCRPDLQQRSSSITSHPLRRLRILFSRHFTSAVRPSTPPLSHHLPGTRSLPLVVDDTSTFGTSILARSRKSMALRIAKRNRNPWSGSSFHPAGGMSD